MINETNCYRLLIVDDNEAIHNVLKKILLPKESGSELAADESFLFGTAAESAVVFEIDSALQGRDGLDCVLRANASGRPYALAFVDIRMPPGWDGVETIGHLWEAQPDLQIVICTAHSDYNWAGITERLGVSDNFVVLKKPFDIMEVCQLAHALTAKWTSAHEACTRIDELDRLVDERSTELYASNVQTKLLEAALRAAANSISITDSKGVVVWTNPASSALYGFPVEEMLGLNRRILKSGRHDGTFYQGMWATISSGQTWRGEIINRRKDGKLTSEEMTITPVESQPGTITHFIAINQDITDRKCAEKALRTAEEKYRAMFEDAVVGIFQATPDGELLNTNRAFAAIYGYESSAQLLAEMPESERSHFIGPESFGEWRSVLRTYGTLQGAEVQVRCRDGARKWVLLNVRAVRNAGGEVVLHEGTMEDITERKLAQQQVKFLAYYDALTGLPNRPHLHDLISKAIAEACSKRSMAAILFLDLDRFKIINDSLGHSFGDMLLQQIAKRLKSQVRQEDTVGRLGGDEFLIVLTNVGSAADVEAMVKRIVDAVIGEVLIQDQLINITCSIGISIFPQHGKDGETLIKNADAAMYCAKEQGRNNFCFFNNEMNIQFMQQLTLENGLRSAIAREELFLVYQPQINVASGDVIGLEALLRWQHPELDIVMPDKFIEIAERSGLIMAIGEWVLETACSQIAQWQQAGLLVVPVAVNVSAAQLRRPGFCELIRTVLYETGLEPKYLELELTESVLLTDADVMFKVLTELKDLGIKLVIDDFGTGYSSLSYLRRLPVTKLKIDRSFIRDVATNPCDAAITTAIISMASSLGLKVIAEGVEDDAQLAFLKRHGCDEFQGYLFSRPLKVEDVASKLSKG